MNIFISYSRKDFKVAGKLARELTDAFASRNLRSEPNVFFDKYELLPGDNWSLEIGKALQISHAHKDRLFVAKLTKILRRHHIKYWFSPKHIVGAQQWHDEIGEALERCDWFLIVLSPNAVKSKWVGHEYFYALNDNRYERKIVPVLYKTCDWKKLSWTLKRFQWVNFKQDHQAASRDLLKTWGL